MAEITNPELRRALAAMYEKDPVFVLRVYQFYAEAVKRNGG